MFGVEFYPTPPAVVEKMVDGLENVSSRSILEPSAGKGDILDKLKDMYCDGYSWRSHLDAYCIEIDINLQAVLREKKYKVIASDFLAWQPQRYFDLVLMNPPFSSGDEHLLHAWEIMARGDIVCLLNEETILNPYTKRRKLLAEIIRQHGSVETLGDCFSTAEHKTGVHVALVHLRKDQPDEYAELFDGLEIQTRTQARDDEEPQDIFLPANRDVIGNLCQQYQDALELFKEVKLAHRRLKLSMAPLVERHAERNHTDFLRDCLDSSSFVGAVNTFSTELTRDAWATLTHMAGVSQLMTAGVQREFDKLIRNHESMDFTKDNIFMLLDTLRNSVSGIMNAALIEVFDLLTKYHDENRVHIEGWKTNDAYAVGKKFILPYVVERWAGSENFHVRYQQGSTLADIDRVMCSLEGRKIDSIVTISQGLEAGFKQGDGRAESEFFTMRYFKKGTVHFTFKDRLLWERFNVEAAKGKAWLPHDYRHEEGCLEIAA